MRYCIFRTTSEPAEVLIEKNKNMETEKPEVNAEAEGSVSISQLTNTRTRTKSETSEDGKGEKKLLGKVKVAVNSEDALDEIAKKLNERALRFSNDKDKCVIRDKRKVSLESTESATKEKKRESLDPVESDEPKSPREEGELTPTPKQIRKNKPTTIIINKPKVVSQAINVVFVSLRIR